MSVKGDDHYYATGYDIENDPYVYDNGVLINHFEITDTKYLNEIEAELSALSIEEILKSPFPASFDSAYLLYLHHSIFKDVYPWAGAIRRVDICKGSTAFLENTKIVEHLDMLFTGLRLDNFYQGLDAKSFSVKAGIFLNQLNIIHPFREGNGRTQRVLLQQIAHQAGFNMNWAAISADAMTNACVAGYEGNDRPMQRLLLINMDSL